MTSLAQTEVFRDYQLLANNFPSFLIFREDDFPFEKYIHHLLPFYFSIHVLCKWGSQLHYFLNILQCSFCSNLKGIRTEMNRQEDPSLPVFLFCREINNFTKKFLCNFAGWDRTGLGPGPLVVAEPGRCSESLCSAGLQDCRRDQEGRGGEKRPG